jgi:hypothetical protein
MNIYKIWVDDWLGYDTFDSAIVVAKGEESARHIHPRGEARGWNNETGRYDKPWYESDECLESWVKPERVNVRLVGTTEIFHEGTVLCASYNAG